MYRVFCESYQNFLNSFQEDNVRLRMAEPIALLTNISRYEEEKKMNSTLYQKLCDLINYMKANVEKYPKFKAFLWTLDSRNIDDESFQVASIEELEEQTKLVNSFLKLAYWY